MRRFESRAARMGLTSLAISIIGCESTPTGSNVDNAQTALAFAMMSSTAEQVGEEEAVVHECPAGGSIVVEGTVTRGSHPDGSVTMWDHSALYDGCGLSRGGRTVTASGHLTTTGEARFGAAVDQRAPLIYQLSHQTGSITMAGDAGMETCTYDVQHRFERESNRYRITGTACGRALNMTAPAQP